VLRIVITSVFAFLLVGGVAVADSGPDRPDDFLRAEYQVLGAGMSATWRGHAAYTAYGQIGGDGMDEPDEIGGAGGQQQEEELDEDDGPSNTGDKVKAGLLSAVLPGAGQFYNGQKKKAYVMFGVEVAIWTAYFVFDSQGSNRMDSAQEYAGIYAGTSGSHAENYWQSVGRYMDSDAYNESRLREARALQESVSGIVSGADTWQWVNDDRRTGYQKLRADANTAYDRRDFMLLFAVVNRAVSVVDAVLGAGKSKPGGLETEVLGMNVEVDMLPSLRDPTARCVISRSF